MVTNETSIDTIKKKIDARNGYASIEELSIILNKKKETLMAYASRSAEFAKCKRNIAGLNYYNTIKLFK